VTRVVLTAGFDRSPHVVALATLLARDGIAVVGVLVVGSANPARIRAYIRQRGFGFIVSAVRRWLGGVSFESAGSPLREYLQKNSVEERSLRRWCKRQRVPYRVVSSLDDAHALSFVRTAQADGVLYGGGGVLETAFIDATRGRILNAHHGPLPEIRGMNACEWSLLLGIEPAVSIHYIERGIDTGPLVERVPIHVRSEATIGALREQCTVAGIEGLRRNARALQEPLPRPHPLREAHKQVFTLAPALREILEERLRARRSGSVWNDSQKERRYETSS